MKEDVSGYDLWKTLRRLYKEVGRENSLQEQNGWALRKKMEAQGEMAEVVHRLKEIKEIEEALRGKIAQIGKQWPNCTEWAIKCLLADLLKLKNPSWALTEMLNALTPDDRIVFLQGCNFVVHDVEVRFWQRRKYRLLLRSLFFHSSNLLAEKLKRERTGAAA